MTRTIQTVSRIGKTFGIPFGGYVANNHPTQIGPANAQRAENVILLYGRIKKRTGFKGWDGIWDQIYTPYGGQIDALFSFVATDYSDGLTVHGFASFGVCKMTKDPGYSNAEIRIWRQPLSGSSYGWQQPSNWSSISSVSKRQGIILAVGQTRRPSSPSNDLDQYETAAFILGGGAFKTPVHNQKVYGCGMPAPVITSSDASPYDGEWLFTVCNQLLAPTNTLLAGPGLESNGSNVTLQTNFPGPIEFTAPDPDVYPWTHVRVYRRLTGSDNYLFVGSKSRDESYFPEVVNPGGEVPTSGTLTYDSGSDTWTLNIDSKYATEASGDGPYDYAPTRNYPPYTPGGNGGFSADYFVEYRGRGFWGSKSDSRLFFSDPQDLVSGGHIEALSGDNLPLQGAMSLLAVAFDQAIIGTSRGLYVLTGDLPSHTNRTIATGANISETAFSIDLIPVDLPPVSGGTGSWCVANGLLYYIGRSGLVAYNGQSAADVSRGIQQLLIDFAIDENGDAQDIWTGAQVCHDAYRNIIYLLVRRDITYDDEATSGGDPAQYVKSRIFCYHYLNTDPLTGLGKWTQFDQIGPGGLAYPEGETTPEELNDDRRDRYSAICIRQFSDGRRPALCIGHRAPTDEGGDPGQYLTYRPAIVLEQQPDEYEDSHVGLTGGDSYTNGITWRWQSGRWNAGIDDREKHFAFLTARVSAAGSPTATLALGFQADDVTEQLFTRTPSGLIVVPIGFTANEISVIFSGETSDEDCEIMAYSLDYEPSGDY